MECVLGFGGFFFKAADPEALARWYAAHLGVLETPRDYGGPAWMQQGGPAVFQPFPRDTSMFPDTGFMLNFRVADLDAMAAQLRSAGIAVEIDAEDYPNGRFASLADPEGNPIQLWQPAGEGEGG